MSRILIVDDNETMRSGIALVIQRMGFEAKMAASGAEALSMLAENDTYDLVITDFRMDEMDGLQVLEAVRRLHADVDVVIITAHGTIDIAVQAMQKGAVDFITKNKDRPFFLYLPHSMPHVPLGVSEKFKSRFKSTIHVYFDKRIKCTFKANIRQHGDFSDHLKLVNGNLFQSVDISLLEGHIDGIINFKLLIQETRKNPNDEIILTELLRSMNYLAPRTNLITVKLNNLTKTMLFQEKEEKEMLEYNLRREGPLLEGDERYVFSKEYKNDYGYIPEQAQLSRQTT